MSSSSPSLLRTTLVNLSYKCNALKSFKQIHAQLVTSGLIQDTLIISKIVGFIRNFVEHEYACKFLAQIHHHPSSYPFNSLITSYAGSNTPQVAILVYRLIVRNGFLPDMFSFPMILKSCTNFLGIKEGKQIHGLSIKMGFSSDLYVENSLLHLYSVCGEYSCASLLFDEMPTRDVVTWTGLISGYVKAGLFQEAIALFLEMDLEPNVATLVSVLVACGRLPDLSMGKGIHGLIFKKGFDMGLVVGNALMDMYVKCGTINEGKELFYELPERDIVSWTSMISGLVQHKHPKEALELFYAMQVSGIVPDQITLATVLSACAILGALEDGRWVHEYIDRRGLKWDVHLGTSMVDMYSKCGNIEMALCIFHSLQERNVFTWNALLGGLAMHGRGREVLNYFEKMISNGVRPNEVTFLAILSACCHCGLVDDGRQHFYQMMGRDYNISPRIEHYGCMVDLLARAGLLDEAKELIKAMPMPPDVLIWGALLSACKAHGDFRLSQTILNHLLELEAHDSGVYVLLSNVYATNERWEDVKRVRRLMKEKGIRKSPGSSVVKVNGKTHEFVVGDVHHPQREEIHLLLNMLAKQVYPEA